jgi:hypothetical protein
MEGIKKAMKGRNLKEGQSEDSEQWNLGVGQRRKNVSKTGDDNDDDDDDEFSYNSSFSWLYLHAYIFQLYYLSIVVRQTIFKRV